MITPHNVPVASPRPRHHKARMQTPLLSTGPRTKDVTTYGMRTRVGFMHSALAASGDADDVAQARSRRTAGQPSPLRTRRERRHQTARARGEPPRRPHPLHRRTADRAGNPVSSRSRPRRSRAPGSRRERFAGGEVADGRRTTAVAGRQIRNNWPNRPAGADQSAEREWSSTLWLTPAPPPKDPLLVVTDGPRCGRVEFPRGCRSTSSGGLDG